MGDLNVSDHIPLAKICKSIIPDTECAGRSKVSPMRQQKREIMRKSSLHLQNYLLVDLEGGFSGGSVEMLLVECRYDVSIRLCRNVEKNPVHPVGPLLTLVNPSH